MSKIDDKYVMPFGKFKGEKLANVPAWYLVFIYNRTIKGINNPFYKFNREVFDYIKENYEDLEQEAMREREKKHQQK